MDKQKLAKKYAFWFAGETSKRGKNSAEMYHKFRIKFLQLANSPEFAEYAKHKVAIDTVYFFITASLLCRELGYSFDETQDILYGIAWPIRRRYRSVINALERLPFGYELFVFVLDKFNQSYGSDIGFDFILREKDRFEYQISKCIYIEIFEHYGIREYCKALCDSDIHVMGGACKNARFIRYSDMSASPVCHDAVVRVKR